MRIICQYWCYDFIYSLYIIRKIQYSSAKRAFPFFFFKFTSPETLKNEWTNKWNVIYNLNTWKKREKNILSFLNFSTRFENLIFSADEQFNMFLQYEYVFKKLVVLSNLILVTENSKKKIIFWYLIWYWWCLVYKSWVILAFDLL